MGPVRTWTLRCGAALLLAAASAAHRVDAAAASDPKAFADLKAKYDKLLKVHDDVSIRERRKMLLECFDYLDQKPCRKLLHEAFDADDSAETRVAAVQVLGASGDPKDLDAIVRGVGKDKLRGATIAIGVGLACTPKDVAPAAAVHAVELASKAKGDLRVALLEGAAELAEPTAYDAVAAIAVDAKTPPDERFERDVALGACGKDKAVAALVAEGKSGDPTVRLGAAVGLAKTGAKESLPALVECLHDLDPRVVETAADALGAAKHQPAATTLVDAMAAAPLRTRTALRAALAAIVGKDYGLDPAPWRDALAGKKPEPPVMPAGAPKPPDFFGIPVASDRVVVVLDLAHHMDWKDRLTRAKGGVSSYLGAFGDAAEFDVFGCSKTTERFSRSMCAGAASRQQATAWVDKQLSAGGFDLERCLLDVFAEQPRADTILLATTSMPGGDSAAATAMEALQVIRRANLSRRVRIDVAFVAPGGRVTTSETDAEFEDRALQLQILAETSGGKFVRIDQ